jgi:hypothetical protein
MSDPAAVPSPPATDKAGAFEDFVDIFFSPAKVFARRAGASPAMPFFVVSILVVALYFVNRNVMSGIMEGEMAKGMAARLKANPSVTAEQLESGKAFGMKVAQFGAIIFIPCGLLVIGFITWLVGKILGGSLSYSTALLIASFAWMPRVVESVLASVQGLLLDTTRMTSHFQIQIGPARFLDPATAPAWQINLLGRVDLITIWVTVLLAIGLVHAGKVPRSKAVVAGVLVWLLGSLGAIYQAVTG